ncbi:hypothetical protein HRE53_32730 (plasmid) [Acaryochloris sp. 'Moss Beach']|uniref:hypothetical protein n=1 Tax=Acaryochloris TaxID=155977 RepID=UPI001BB09729|nr:MULTISPECIES: hypothetical protein [Acaryochloris]QUY45829.1 hypothetical protein I1H34_29245 [Acaryochloris marina S15]UJB73401.1 hypothetical protein HRE53_32730 [Acaryochloris sp. 'Moss Beach']
MKRITKDEIAMAFMVLSVGLIPSAAIAEVGGLKPLARRILWGSAASLGGCLVTVPRMTKEHSKIWHREEQVRDYLYCQIHQKYPRHNVKRFIKNGAAYLRKITRLNLDEARLQQINPEHTYLTMLWLYEMGAFYIVEGENQRITWRLNFREIPWFSKAYPHVRDKCFSCRYWVDPSGEIEAYGKEPSELTCAVNPLHTDTFKGCEQYKIDALKPDLSQCINKVTR